MRYISKIEIAPKEYHITTCSYDEALLYCFQLNIDGKMGWRLPKKDNEEETSSFFPIWREDDSSQNDAVLKSRNFWCVPVRDITND
jgi:hypothetical protein